MKIIMVILFLIFNLFSHVGHVAAQLSHNYVIILLDASGSMKQSDPHFLRREATALLIHLLRPGDRVVLAEFGEDVRELTPGAVILKKDSPQEILHILDRLSSKDRHTDILAALRRALFLVSSLPLETRQAFNPSVILLTDGKDDVPGKENRPALIEATIKELAALRVPVHAVGFSQGADLPFLRQVADLTGGDLYVIHRDTDLLKGFFALSRVLGNRWPLVERSVDAGTVNLPLPSWARRALVCYLPAHREQNRISPSSSPTQAINTSYYQILSFETLPTPQLDITLPGKGMLLVDAEADLFLQIATGKRVPAQLPFLFHARVVAPSGGRLTGSHFLSKAVMSLNLWQEGQDEIRVTLYDDGGHEDGEPADGLFGGLAPGLGEGPWRYRLTFRAIQAPHLKMEGQVETLAAPVTVKPTSRILQALLSPFTGRLHLYSCNQADVPLQGEFVLTDASGRKISQTVAWKGGECQPVTLSLPDQALQGGKLQASLRLPLRPEPVWQDSVGLIPRWVVPSGLLALFLLLGLTFIFPRRSVQGATLAIRGLVAREEFSGIYRINREGRVDAPDLPAPYNDPGRFFARSGVWFRGVVYTPASWCQPIFPGKTRIPRRRQGYLLRGPATWECKIPQGKVEYRFSPRR